MFKSKKMIMITLHQFSSFLATREEFIMCRPKHEKKVDIKEVYSYSDPFESESDDNVYFHISADVLVCRKYEDDNRIELSIEHIQNGVSHELCSLNKYLSWLVEPDYDTMDKYEEIIKSFKKRGFEVLF